MESRVKTGNNIMGNDFASFRVGDDVRIVRASEPVKACHIGDVCKIVSQFQCADGTILYCLDASKRIKWSANELQQCSV